MSDYNDEDLLRYDDEDDLDEFGRGDDSSSSDGASVLATPSASSPAGPQNFTAFSVLMVLGTESEGSAGTTSSVGQTIFAYVPKGATPPVSGNEYVLTYVRNRWTLTS